MARPCGARVPTAPAPAMRGFALALASRGHQALPLASRVALHRSCCGPAPVSTCRRTSCTAVASHTHGWPGPGCAAVGGRALTAGAARSGSMAMPRAAARCLHRAGVDRALGGSSVAALHTASVRHFSSPMVSCSCPRPTAVPATAARVERATLFVRVNELSL